jgi:predicted nucleotidyltransferase
MTLFDFAGMKLDLEKRLKRSVDVITYKSVHPLLKKYILTNQKIFYEKR